MGEETRRQFNTRIIDDFLESSDTSKSIDLYSDEIRRVTNLYSGILTIEKGPKTLKEPDDKRYKCRVSKIYQV